MTQTPVIDLSVDATVVDGTALAENCVLFGRLLRRAGVGVDPGQTRDFARILVLLGLDHKRDVKAAGRTIFVRRREEFQLFDAAFELFWRRRGSNDELATQLPRIRQQESHNAGLSPQEGRGKPKSEDDLLDSVAPGSASRAELLRHADFAQLTSEEARDASRRIEALRPSLPQRRARRGEPDRKGQRPAARAMLRRALATGGQPVVWRRLHRIRRPRPLALVCDISGSMERYSRFLLRFAHALTRSGARVEVFVFSTRHTRITRQLRTRDPDTAIRQVIARVVDWNGGTRIGDSLHELNRTWVRRTIKSSAVVLLASDGWERGDVTRLATEMATLRRSCFRLIWLDPLASRPGFEPATSGLVAALPHVDRFLPCGNVASLEGLGRRIADWRKMD